MRVLVTFHKAAINQLSDSIIKSHNGVVCQKHIHIPVVLADLPDQSSIDGLKSHPDVKAVEEVIPNAVRILGGPKLTSDSVPWNIVKIKATAVQARGNIGSNIKVGIIDTGIDYSHSDLEPNYVGGYNFIANTIDPMDDNGHGTHVAGIIAAASNGAGILGVAPGAKLYALKVINSTGQGEWPAVIAAYDWCIQNGIQVTNNSYGGAAGSVALEAALDAASAAGIIIVCAAGNSGPSSETVLYPALYPSAIAVGATDSQDVIANFSSRGAKVELSAPGVNILSCYLGNTYQILNGTSMACPHVVGAVALGLRAGILNTDIRARLAQSAHDLGAVGRDSDYGFGLIDCLAFVTNTIPSIPIVSPTVNFDGSISSDSDGSVISWSWDFGDGTNATGQTAQHTFSNPGPYTIVLTVTDDKGAIGTTSRQLIVSGPTVNQPPVAEFVVNGV